MNMSILYYSISFILQRELSMTNLDHFPIRFTIQTQFANLRCEKWVSTR